jgi:isopentenyl diphosphate isomerase/L-lactate dehydrogenase-like FMN-dependent dehydrogenase
MGVASWPTSPTWYALGVLPRSVYDYYRSGSDVELTLRANRSAFNEFRVRPRMLRDVSKVRT